MNNASSERRERLEMLLADEAIGQLNDDEQQQLTALLLEFPDFNRDGFRKAAAAFGLAFADEAGFFSTGPLPDALRRKISEAAAEYLPPNLDVEISLSQSASGASDPVIRSNLHPLSTNGQHSTGTQAGPGGMGMLRPTSHEPLITDAITEPQKSVASRVVIDPRRHVGLDPWRWMGWIVATAALLCLMFFNFSGKTERSDALTTVAGGGDAVAAREDFQQRLDDLLEVPSTEKFAWTPGPTPLEAEVSGGVVWNQGEQSGFMTFDGMPVNDPQVQQYQLWIIDPLRDEHPIDGGVFNIRSQGQVVIPIDPKLEVLDPRAFAITIEKPGGVVVSDQTQLPLLAAVD